jgi:hypothetical protein
MKVLIVEHVLTILAVIVVFTVPLYERDACRRIWRAFDRLAQRREVSVLLVGLLALAFRAAILPLLPVPQPQVHDEFSYLLAADTFASGRLTNPPHALWEHFETFHVNQQPTYASMYPPAQGLVLAAGKVFGGHPWFGVWVSVSLMCAALCWMLQGWLPARWALLGGVIAIIRIAIFSYWGNSYWGGAVAATAGAMVLGALPRLLKPKARVRDVLLLGSGVVILANSRPYEGLILCIPVGIALFGYSLHEGTSARSTLRGLMPLLLLLLMIGAGLMGYYFWRVTGSPFRMPYQVNQQTYAMGQAFLWQSPRIGLQYRHQEMHEYYEAWLEAFMQARSSVRGFLSSCLTKTLSVWLFYFGPVLSLSLFGLPWALRDRRIRLLVITGSIALLGVLVETWFHPHYVAPFTGLIYVLMLQSMRHLNHWRSHGRRTGESLVLIIPLISILMLVVALLTRPAKPVQGRSYGEWCCSETGPSQRSRLLANLNAQGGRHLVIVQYGPAHDVDTEWVYNEADIDHAQVVFARDMGAAENAVLIQYFKDRKVWLLAADDTPPTARPFH